MDRYLAGSRDNIAIIPPSEMIGPFIYDKSHTDISPHKPIHEYNWQWTMIHFSIQDNLIFDIDLVF